MLSWSCRFEFEGNTEYKTPMLARGRRKGSNGGEVAITGAGYCQQVPASTRGKHMRCCQVSAFSCITGSSLNGQVMSPSNSCFYPFLPLPPLLPHDNGVAIFLDTQTSNVARRLATPSFTPTHATECPGDRHIRPSQTAAPRHQQYIPTHTDQS